MTLRIAVAFAALVLAPSMVTAQEAATPAQPGGKLTFELNKAQTTDGSCGLTFVVQNDTGTVIQKSTYNLAIIDSHGIVSQLINIEFRPMPVGTPKVQGFTLRDIACEDISAISINEFNECTTDTGEASSLCEDAIAQSSRTSIEFPWVL